MIYDAISGHLTFFFLLLLSIKFMLYVHFQLVGLWFALSVGTLAATVSPSVSPGENTKLTSASSSLGPLVYREARDYSAHEGSAGGGGGVGNAGGGGGGYYRPYDRPQQNRCISCLYAAMTGNQDRDR